MDAASLLLICGTLLVLLISAIYVAASKIATSSRLEKDIKDEQKYREKQSKLAQVQKEIAAYQPSTVAESSARMRALAKRNAERLRSKE